MAQYNKTKRCQLCGCKFIVNAHNAKFCPVCRRENKRAANEARKQHKKIEASPLSKVMAELNAYNEKHKTNLSYGKFVAVMEGRLKK